MVIRFFWGDKLPSRHHSALSQCMTCPLPSGPFLPNRALAAQTVWFALREFQNRRLQRPADSNAAWLREMKADGMGAAEIAKALGIGRTSIAGHCSFRIVLAAQTNFDKQMSQ
jgi:hypothetical protein